MALFKANKRRIDTLDNLPDCCYYYRYESPKCTTVDNCDNCGCNIHEGEEYYYIQEINICKDCIAEFKKTAEMED